MSLEVHIDWQAKTHLAGHLHFAEHSPAVSFEYAPELIVPAGTAFLSFPRPAYWGCLQEKPGRTPRWPMASVNLATMSPATFANYGAASSFRYWPATTMTISAIMAS
jgi:hypothetical protein